MARKKTKKKKSRAGKRKRAGKGKPGKTKRLFSVVGGAVAAGWRCAPVRHFAVGAVVLATIAVLFHEMGRRVAGMPGFRVEFSCLDLYSPEEFPWIKEDEMRRLLRVPFKSSGRSIFDPKLLSDVRRTFLKNPWVGSVDMVQRRYPNTVTFKVTLRRPVAYLKKRGRLYVISSEGMRLPGVYPKPVPELSLPVVKGITWSEPVPRIGTAYRSAGIKEALDLVAILDANRKLLEAHNERIAEIDVGNIGSTQGSEVNFILTSGIVFEWGRMPGSGNLSVLSTKAKLENLKRALERQGRLRTRSTVSLWSASVLRLGSP